MNKFLARIRRRFDCLLDCLQRCSDAADEIEGLPHGNLIYLQRQLDQIIEQANMAKALCRDYQEKYLTADCGLEDGEGGGD